jgi:iron complex outermembrane recepter protein
VKKISLFARFSAGAAMLAACLLASAQDITNRDPEAEAAETSPIETIIVVGKVRRPKPSEDVTTPVLEGRLATLEDLLRDTPGVQIEPVFGGIDHPRFSIRGSGLQRGTQPAGRGIELRLDGLPITYADTSFDFVEFLEPLFFGEVGILRGGRGALEGGSTLGGIVDFRGRSGTVDPGFTARGEIGSFDYLRGQAAYAGSSDDGEGFASVSWFSQDGFREYGAQEALRAYGRYSHDVSDSVTLRISGSANDSELELPGPQTLAQIDAGSKAAQPNGILGDWRRFTDQYRLSSGISVDLGGPRIELDAAYMVTDVEFRRRDVQVEDNDDFTFAARLRDNHEADLGWGATIIYQRNDRRQQQFFNGGGTPPTFNGARGDQWADNDLSADRLTAQLKGHVKPADNIRLDVAAGWDWHERNITDNFAGIRAERPATQLDDSYDGFNGLALFSVDIEPSLTLFAGISHVIEPPTYDVLLINAAGMPGPNNALLNGPNPRRPVVRQLDEQTAITAETGIRGQVGDVRLDFTLYRAWINNEIVSTTNAVTQNVTSVGNADDTRRWGIESSIGAVMAEDFLSDGDRFDVSADWTWTDARFENDPIFGDNFLPIVVEHRFGARTAYRSGRVSADLFVTYIPDGGFADYANTLRADGFATIGERVSYDTGRLLIFVEGRNLSDERYASSVIGARNNVGGQDNPTFAPGEPAAVTVGLQARF